MKIHFNSIGIITNVRTDEDSLRQGSVGTVLETTFEGINNNYYSAKLNFSRSDGSNISSVAMLWDSENTETFRFVFDDPWFFALSGATTITVFLYDAKGKVIANGQYRFYIEPTDYNEEPTITINQFNALMTALAGKVGVPTSSVFVSKLPEKGESGVFYVVREGENNTNIYVYNANTEDYVWVGTNDLNLGNYTTKKEQFLFEAKIDAQVEQIRGEVINPYVAVETISQLPSTNQNKLYVVKETNAWYYWNGIAYVLGGGVIPPQIEAVDVEYDDEYTRLEVENVQEAIEKLAGKDGYLENQINEKLDKNGYSALAHVGLADNIASPDGITQDTNISLSPTGGTASITDGFVEIKEIKGLTLIVNQLTKDSHFNSANGWFTISTNASISVADNIAKVTKTSDGMAYLYRANSDYPTLTTHKYLHIAVVRTSDNAQLKFNCGNSLMTPQNIVANTWTTISFIASPTTFSGFSSAIDDCNTLPIGGYFEVKEYIVIDLTQMFGAGKEPTTVAEFNNLTRHNDVDTYNEGTLLSSRPYSLISTLFNAFDGEIESGTYNNNTGVKGSETNAFRATNLIRVDCGGTYTLFTNVDYSGGQVTIFEYDKNENYLGHQYSYSAPYAVFTLKVNTCYVAFAYYKQGSGWGTTLPTNAQICFHLTHSGYRNGQYEPYVKNIFKLPEGVLNEPLRSAGTVYDSWVKGHVIRRIGVVDLGTLGWQYAGANIFYASLDTKATDDYTKANILCPIYTTVKRADLTSGTICISGTDVIIQDTTYTDVATFKQSLSGVILNFELAEPIITDYTDEESWDIPVSDFGTLQAVSVGRYLQLGRYVIFYMNNLRDFVRGIGNREDIDYQPENIVSQEQLQAEKVIREQLKEALGGTLRQVLATSKGIDFNNTAWVDLGTLNWQYQIDRYFYATFNGAKAGTDNLGCDIVCSKYARKDAAEIYNKNVDKAVVINAPFTGSNKIIIRDTAYTDTATFKQSLANVIIAYEKA